MSARAYHSPYMEARRLVKEGVIDVRWSDWFGVPPPAIPDDVDIADRVEGMMLGLAIGDSLGNTSESLLPAVRQERHGWIESYLPNQRANGRRIGLPSDDSQLAFWTVRHLVSHRRLDSHHLAAAFTHHRIFGIGRSVREFLANFKSGTPWEYAGARSAGNGALMRIAPLLIPYLKAPNTDLWADTLIAAHLTHRDVLSNTACLAFAHLLWHLMCRTDTPDRMWWMDTYLSACENIETDKPYRPRSESLKDFDGPLSQLLRAHVMPALERDLPVREACGIWQSGAYLLETVPCVIYILARHGHDPREAILMAVNETRDNDTIAAIVGAAVGALHGHSSIPAEWIDGLSGRTREEDDGAIFALLSEGGRAFGYGATPQLMNRLSPKPSRPSGARHRRPSADDVIQVIDGSDKPYWIKVIGMLQQNWAIIDNPDGSERASVFFFNDMGEVFDSLSFRSTEEARLALLVNGFDEFDEDEYKKIAKKPERIYVTTRAHNPIYSSGQYWISLLPEWHETQS